MKWGYVFVIVLSTLLFVGGPDDNSHRIIKECWDNGHVVLFAGLTLLLLIHSMFGAKNGWVQFAVVTIYCLILGFAIEYAQLTVGRNYEIKDVVHDVLGGWLGLLVFTLWTRRLCLINQVFLYVLIVVLIFVGFRPLALVIADDLIMRETFPVLADFETPFELSRWDTHLAEVAIDSGRSRSGDHAMRIQFLPGEYPDVTLKDFPSDWSDYKTINFSLYSSSKAPLPMEIRIYDRRHRASHHRPSDRFNPVLNLTHGWNDFNFELEQIRQAPQGREMDLSDMVTFSLSVEQVDEPMLIYLDHLHLAYR